MNTTRGILGAALFGCLLALVGCGGSGEYRIPNVEPVVKQKPEEDDLLKDIEDGDQKSTESPKEGATPAPAGESKPESKPVEAKPPAAPKK